MFKDPQRQLAKIAKSGDARYMVDQRLVVAPRLVDLIDRLAAGITEAIAERSAKAQHEEIG
jgi:hypothetical protein